MTNKLRQLAEKALATQSNYDWHMFKNHVTPQAILSLLDRLEWKKPNPNEYVEGIMVVEVDLSSGDVCRGLVIQNDQDINELLYADNYNDVWTDFQWSDVDRYFVLPLPEAPQEQDNE